MLWGGVSEPYTEHFKAGKRKLNKEQSSSEQEALSKATSQTPRATDSAFHMRHRYYPQISSHGQLSRPYYDSSI